MPEIQTITLPVSIVTKMLDIIQQRPYREAAPVMQELQIWQTSQADKQPVVPDKTND